MSEKQFETLPPNGQKKKRSFLARRLNTLVALFVILAVLVAGYFFMKSFLKEEMETPTTTEETFELLPGEVKSENGKNLFIFPSVDQKDISQVLIHNPSLKSSSPDYVDWGIEFLYDKENNRSIGYVIGHSEDLILDETHLTLFVAAAGNMLFSRRVVDVCEDYSIYGLSEEDATRVELKTANGEVYTVYIGKLNPSGTAYYARSGDTVTDQNGNPYERKSVYLLTNGTTSYVQSTLTAPPTDMLSTLMAYPVNPEIGFSSFELFSVDKSIAVSLRPRSAVLTAEKLFGGSFNYYAVEPAGYFASTTFDTRIDVFEMFQGDKVMEYGTKLVTGTDDDGKEYTLYDFETDVLVKYGLDATRVQYIMRFSAKQEESATPIESEIWFSALQPDGYYYARSLMFNTIVRVDPQTVDFLGWKTVDFLDAYALRLNIGNAAKLTLKGKINGNLFEESFVPSSQFDGSEYIVKSVRAEKLNKQLSMTYYRELFRELLSITLQGSVPEDLDKEALLQTEPYFEMRIETPKYNKCDKFPDGLESVTRVLRFYQYTNGRALVTVEMIDASGKSSGQSGSFYVRVSRLDKLLSDAQKLCNGEEFSYRDKE